MTRLLQSIRSSDQNKLCTKIKPIQYHLKIFPNILENIFHARCIISLEISNPDNDLTQIVLNGSGLNIRSVKLVGYDYKKNKFIKTRYISTYIDTLDDQLIFEFDFIPDVIGMLIIKYSGQIRSDLTGLYKSETNNQTIISTQFQPCHARKCFPCFDEPNFKAKFKIEIKAKNDQLVLSNTDIEEIDVIDSEYSLYKFEITPLMSTYLVAFYIGYATFIESHTETGSTNPTNPTSPTSLRIRIYTNSNPELSALALSTATTCMNFMTDYFDTPYPLNKLDLITVPEFIGGAMENWGLIFFREKYLVDDPHMSVADRLELLYVICHEIAHQWFGNLVTMKSWSYLWLNESFATWMGWLAVEHINPSYKQSEFIFKRNILSALEDDSIRNSHPVEFDIVNPSNINEIFDTISYDKGSAILAMLANYVGHETFKAGIRLYIKRHSYQNTTTFDFSSALEHVSGIDIQKIMSNWINQQNYPIVTLSYHTPTHLKIKQEVFCLSEPEPETETEIQTIWHIPLTQTFMLDQAECIVSRSDINTQINPGTTGFYRIHYDSDIMDFIITSRLNYMSDLDIASMISNMYHVLKADHIKFDYYLDRIGQILSKSLKSDFVWSIVHSNYSDFKLIVKNPILLHKFDSMLCTHIADFKSDIVFGLGCKMNIPSCIARAIDIFNNFKSVYKNNKSDRPNELHLAMAVGIHHDWDFVLELINSGEEKMRPASFPSPLEKRGSLFFSTDTHFKMVALNCAGLVSDPVKYISVLDLFKTNKVKLQNKPELFAVAGKNRFQNHLLWPYIKSNWNQIRQMFGPQQLCVIIGSIQYVCGTLELVTDIKNFFVTNDPGKFTLTLGRTIELMQINHQFNVKLTN